jgi:hypothetical protein
MLVLLLLLRLLLLLPGFSFSPPAVWRPLQLTLLLMLPKL